ncbi:MAG: hypothetical protein JRL30_10980 [Deltaproteobacteria bacterium]|nr:hypothetical protein [Deltaproteobacteria bacterium]
MFDEKEANYYQNYISSLQGARITILPTMNFSIDYGTPKNTPYTLAQEFMNRSEDPSKLSYLDDFFNQKKELSEDKVNLVLEEITGRERLREENLSGLYEDLLRINNWRLERGIHQYYQKDRTWSDFNKMELQIRDQIRRELKECVRDTSFPQKDLRESLLDFKQQTRKSQMIEEGIDIGLEGPNNTQEGDLYQSTYQNQPLY